MKCKCCGKELVVADTQNYSKDKVKFIQKTFHCTNIRCDEYEVIQKASITCPE